MTIYFTFENPSDKTAIPEDWKKLSHMIQDMPEGFVEMGEIPLLGYDKPELDFLIKLTEFIKTSDEKIYDLALENNALITTMSFNNLKFDMFYQIDEGSRIKALNLSDYLGLVIARKFLIGAMAETIIRYKDDIISINKFVGGKMLTAQDCIDSGIRADDILWETFPNIKKIIFS